MTSCSREHFGWGHDSTRERVLDVNFGRGQGEVNEANRHRQTKILVVPREVAREVLKLFNIRVGRLLERCVGC